MPILVTCPICAGRYDGKCIEASTNGRDARGFNCDTCGEFEISGTLYSIKFSQSPSQLTDVLRATMAFHLANESKGTEPFLITTYNFDAWAKTAKIQTPIDQARYFIRIIGEHQSEFGSPLTISAKIPAKIGSFDWSSFTRLLSEMEAQGDIRRLSGEETRQVNGRIVFFPAFELTLKGWQQFDAEKRGQISGEHAFIAMKFNDPKLDSFVSTILKPLTLSSFGYDLLDMRDRPKAGVIDNLMRVRIRDSAFVVVDLTHDNPGAYWEAGYAEGLGKPVIYICERGKFETAKTHFDTNHCTTVPWEEVGTNDEFCKTFVATVRGSLGQRHD